MSEDARDRMAERIAEIEARIQHGMAGDAMVLMREHVPWLLEQLRTAQAEITTLRARDIGWKMECDELRAAARNRQRWILDWAIKTFGPIADDINERSARFVEEAVEAVFAFGLSREIVEKIIARIYSRPAGELGREIGQAAPTLDALAECAGFVVENEVSREAQRIQSIPQSEWNARHAAKVSLGIALDAAEGKGTP